MLRFNRLGLATLGAFVLAFVPADAAELHFVGMAGDRSNGALVFGHVMTRGTAAAGDTAGGAALDATASTGTTADASTAGDLEGMCLLMDVQGDYHLALLVGAVDAGSMLVLEGTVVFSTNPEAEGAVVQIALSSSADLLLDSPAVADGPLGGWVEMEEATAASGDEAAGSGQTPQSSTTVTPARKPE